MEEQLQSTCFPPPSSILNQPEAEPHRFKVFELEMKTPGTTGQMFVLLHYEKVSVLMVFGPNLLICFKFCIYVLIYSGSSTSTVCNRRKPQNDHVCCNLQNMV
ncbi:hypothetical protein ILYODFUR_028318 [Ilyodon furcidens]|uniref:Uncharacterized protein n=1 Tax=Ilyodon furcidens TaxID=33524 RepID=A0ABV0UZ63_9TELE